MTAVRVIDEQSVLAAITPEQAIDYVRDGFRHYAKAEWTMPAKVYLDAPKGDFRAMPALGDGIAILKWVTSIPENPQQRQMLAVNGLAIVSDATSGEPIAIVDGRAVTALRTGAVAAVASRAIAREKAKSVGIIGCGLHGSWVARCMIAAGYGEGVCSDIDPAAAERLAGETGWAVGTREAAAACDIVCTVTPGAETVVHAADLRPGQHINALGADGPGKSEIDGEALLQCRLFCDEWEQAAHGGELCGAVAAGKVSRGDVTELGWLLTGVDYKQRDDETTMFDSTGLAIQDLAICAALIKQLRNGELDAPTAHL